MSEPDKSRALELHSSVSKDELACARQSVTTEMNFAASPAEVWDGLLFYEEIDRRPPLYLRLLLPVPVRISGKAAEIGAEATCEYESGHLLKRVTRTKPKELYEFEVAEQELPMVGGLRLSGGGYTLSELPNGQTRVIVETRYSSKLWPRWFWKPLEAMVCHWFHRYLLGAMRRDIEAS